MAEQIDIIEIQGGDGKVKYPKTSSAAVGMSDGSGTLDKTIHILEQGIIPQTDSTDGSDLEFADESGNVLAKFDKGHIRTKNFDSEQAADKTDVQTLQSSVATLEQGVIPQTDSTDGSDLEFADESGNILAKFDKGHIITKNFDSEQAVKKEDLDKIKGDVSTVDDDSFSKSIFSIADENKNVVAVFAKGHIKTQNFDSEKVSQDIEKSKSGANNKLLHIVVLGQSLSVGWAAHPVLDKVDSNMALMFHSVRTQNMMGRLGLTMDAYNADPIHYNSIFYGTVKPLQEELYHGEGETPASGVVESLLNEYTEMGMSDLPFKVLCTASGFGGASVTEHDDNNDKIINRTMTDIVYAMRYANSQGLAYNCLFVWVQGEKDAYVTLEEYKKKVTQVYNNIKENLKKLGIYYTRFFSYQTFAASSSIQLAQMELSNEVEWFQMTYPIYNLKMASDNVHLCAESSRAMGNAIGHAIFQYLNGGFETLKIINVEKSGNNLTVFFNKNIVSDYEHLDRTFFEPEQNTLLQQNLGFYVKNSAGEDILTTATIEDGAVRLTCSDVPTELFYGVQNVKSFVMSSGMIREAKVYQGYKKQPLYLYMPTQHITTFSNQFIY